MASIKYTAFVNEVKGKISGSVMQGGYGGSVIKGKDKKGTKSGGGKLTHADAGRLLKPKNTIAAVATAWQSLSLENRLSWESLALNRTFTNRFSDKYKPSGFQVYMQVNTNLINFGYEVLTSAPGQYEWPVPDMDTNPVYINWDGIILFAWFQVAMERVIISVSPPVRGSSSPVHLSYTAIQITEGTVPANVNVTTATKKYRGTVQPGQTLWYKFQWINLNSGMVSEPVYKQVNLI